MLDHVMHQAENGICFLDILLTVEYAVHQGFERLLRIEAAAVVQNVSHFASAEYFPKAHIRPQIQRIRLLIIQICEADIEAHGIQVLPGDFHEPLQAAAAGALMVAIHHCLFRTQGHSVGKRNPCLIHAAAAMIYFVP